MRSTKITRFYSQCQLSTYMIPRCHTCGKLRCGFIATVSILVERTMFFKFDDQTDQIFCRRSKRRKIGLFGRISGGVCCSVTQWVAVLLCVTVCCSVLQCVAVCCVIRVTTYRRLCDEGVCVYVYMCCSMLQYVAVCCSVMQCVAVWISVAVWLRTSALQCVAIDCLAVNMCVYTYVYI